MDKITRNTPSKWKMHDEINFLKNIGTWKSDQLCSPTQLLKGYIKGLKLRKDMEELHKRKLFNVANSLIVEKENR